MQNGQYLTVGSPPAVPTPFQISTAIPHHNHVPPPQLCTNQHSQTQKLLGGKHSSHAAVSIIQQNTWCLPPTVWPIVQATHSIGVRTQDSLSMSTVFIDNTSLWALQKRCHIRGEQHPVHYLLHILLWTVMELPADNWLICRTVACSLENLEFLPATAPNRSSLPIAISCLWFDFFL